MEESCLVRCVLNAVGRTAFRPELKQSCVKHRFRTRTCWWFSWPSSDAESGYPLNSHRSADAFRALLGDERFGRVWLIESDGVEVGYVVVTLGFSMEYGAPDAFIDDLFVRPHFGAPVSARLRFRGSTRASVSRGAFVRCTWKPSGRTTGRRGSIARPASQATNGNFSPCDWRTPCTMGSCPICRQPGSVPDSRR